MYTGCHSMRAIHLVPKREFDCMIDYGLITPIFRELILFYPILYSLPAAPIKIPSKMFSILSQMRDMGN